jgi:serine/threonine protein kinase
MSSPSAVKGSACAWVRGEVLGHGTLGSVFKALNQRTGQIFAVKEVRIDSKDNEDLKFKESLENEISIYKDLHHPRIVSYLGHDDIDSKLCIYLEYMPGGSVTQVLSQFGSFDEQLIAQYSRDLLEGLEYLHTRHPVVLHRDVKGANILVGLDCRVKLSDFGCSKRAVDTLARTLSGSVPWMAPEVIQQTGYGRRSDVWSLGCVAIEMATAKHPWGKFDNLMQAMMRIGMSKDTPPLPESVSDLCRDFITQCTQRDKNLRPLSTALLQHDFVRNITETNDT